MSGRLCPNLFILCSIESLIQPTPVYYRAKLLSRSHWKCLTIHESIHFPLLTQFRVTIHTRVHTYGQFRITS